MEIQRPTYLVDLFTSTRKVEGAFQPFGIILDDINDPDKGYFYLADVTFTSLDPNARLRPVNTSEAVVSKDDVLFVCFRDENIIEQFRMLRRVERMIVYTPGFALRGDFHLGVEQQVRDMFDTMRGRFQPMTDVTLFSLIETRVAVPREQKIVLINIHAVQLYHPEIAAS